MIKDEFENLPFELDSPVEFVLVGVIGNRRSVVAKSKGAKLDLIAYAQRKGSKSSGALLHSNVLFFPKLTNLVPMAVDSQPKMFYRNHDSDTRASEWTLVWRGAAYNRHMDLIKKELELRIDSIVLAFETESLNSLEWALSPVIDLCNISTIYSIRKKVSLSYALAFTFVVYIVCLSAFFIFRLM
ncbi:hypothetical protein AB0Y29_16235 [Enterobacter hormaechei]|uniref:hypothetical protein n=1 Tax=Enterobacter hormaechei TaxID=158836 RepID=UPI003F28BA14